MDRQIIFKLVEGDSYQMPVRFTGLTLSDYSSIVLKFKLSDGRLKNKTVTPDETDDELGTVSWSSSDLQEGEHRGGFRFEKTDGTGFTLPRGATVIFKVRGRNG